MTNEARLATNHSIVNRRSQFARPTASSTSPQSVWSDWMSPTSARIWMTGIASDHFGPRTTSTKSGATMARPTSAGIEITPTRRVARSQMSAIRGRSSLICAKAGKKTCWSGPAMRENGTRTMFVASA